MKGVRRVSGQVAMEYLMIFSIAFFMTIPLVIIFTTQTQNMQADITSAQLAKLSSEIMDSVQEVYFMGEPSQKTLYVSFPAGINSVSVDSNFIRFNVSTAELDYEFVKESTINLTGSLSSYEGTHIVVVKSQGNIVVLSD